jgi:iron(III) transport system ATP-binding protein
MRFEIRRLHDEFKITTVYVTHDQSEAMVTSDRIAVMNQGRIEQVDDPQTLYTRPKTRFVAGFIGRTNFVEATCNGSDVVFDRFHVKRASLMNGESLAGKVTFSIRPQSLKLHRAAAPSDNEGRPGASVRVIERAYLGEHWDYVVVADGGHEKLKVSAPPLEVYAVGDAAWLEIDPQQIAAVS